MRIRTVAAAFVIAVAPLTTQGVIAVAQGGERWVSVPEKTVTTSVKHQCFDGKSHTTCTSVDSLTVGAHQELHMDGALACWGTYYGTYTETHWEYGGFGNLLWKAWLTGEDWYNGCSVGIVWGPSGPGNCQAYEGWQCSAEWERGAFWNSGIGAEDHYRDQYTDYWVCPPLTGCIHAGQYTTGLRFYLRPNGSYWGNQWSQCMIC